VTRKRVTPHLSYQRVPSQSPEEAIILLSACTTARRFASRDRAQQLMEALDWARLAEMLRARGLLATLGPRILELGGECSSADFAAAIEEAIVVGSRQAALLHLVSTHIMAALADAGIRSTALKGPLLGEAIYGEPGRRQSSDIDLLVATEQLSAAVEVVRGLGYQAPGDHVEGSGLPLLHFALAHDRGELPPVELHWRIHWYERDFARERLLAPDEDPSGRWRPAPADELAALLLFYARDGFIGLRLATDLSAWWDTFGANVQPGALGVALHDYPALRRAVLVAICVAERVVGIPATQIMGSVVKPGLRERMAINMANPTPRANQAQLYADIGLIDWLLAPRRGAFGFIRRQVLVPHDVRLQRARTAGKRRATSSVGHSARVVGRYVLAIGRLVFLRR
jgi:Uncharacterised nucleotidyltransferase